MKDIAAELGISTVSVWKAFHNHKEVGAATRERVLRRMKELNYHPNMAAQSLLTGQTYIVGLIVPDLVHAFFSEVAKSLSNALHREGFGLVISSSNEDEELENEEIEHMMRRVDALLIASCQRFPRRMRQVSDSRVPLILLDRKFATFGANFVGSDDIEIGAMATGHLVATGRRKIAHIGGANVSTSVGRLAGCKRVLAEKGIALPEGYVVKVATIDHCGDVNGREAMEHLLKHRSIPDAVFCHNDSIAIGAMTAILERGLRIPEDIALIGVGNIRYAESLRVPLSTIDMSSDVIGENAARLALQLIAGGKAQPKPIYIAPRLIVRASSAPRKPD